MHSVRYKVSILKNIILLQAIERVAMPGSSEVYTVVNKSAPSVQVKQPVVTPEHLPNFQAGQSEKPAAFTDPSYVNQSSVEKPISCPRSLNKVRVVLTCLCIKTP